MKLDKEKTVVVFRIYKEGDVIALFPHVDEGHGRCQSYMHVGMHGPADYTGVVQSTRLAKPDEYTSLARELGRLGYRLDIRRRK